MDYPHELMFPSGRVAPGMIRLKVAAVVACIDTGSIEGTEIEESDLQAFLGPRQAWHEAHAFVNIEPTGNLGRLTAQTIDALCASIRAGEIKPLRLRMKLNGEIDTRETWLLVDDFDLHCPGARRTPENDRVVLARVKLYRLIGKFG